ncbi:tripartite tricarboxylate transporter TctB family protein [Roseibium sp.]|uniref:tripartite tricarboxylate transporter TctB family protein n=1 Tax=Roseibium sp. TaxID=1936156 RepID=UPI003B52F5CB
MSETTRSHSHLRSILPLAFFAAAGVYGLYEAQGMTDFGAIFPRFASGVIVLASAAQLIQHLRGKEAAGYGSGTLLRPLLLLAVLLGWALLLPVLGFVPTSLLGAGLAWLIASQEPKPLKTRVLQASSLAALVLVVDFVFGQLLLVPLP